MTSSSGTSTRTSAAHSCSGCSDQEIADAALAGPRGALPALDTAVLEALILKGALGMTDEDIDHLAGLGYARDADHALELVETAEYDAAFFMAPTPVERVQAVAAAGESMPPKSTYFFPKVPTGLLFNPLASSAIGERYDALRPAPATRRTNR